MKMRFVLYIMLPTMFLSSCSSKKTIDDPIIIDNTLEEREFKVNYAYNTETMMASILYPSDPDYFKCPLYLKHSDRFVSILDPEVLTHGDTIKMYYKGEKLDHCFLILAKSLPINYRINEHNQVELYYSASGDDNNYDDLHYLIEPTYHILNINQIRSLDIVELYAYYDSLDERNLNKQIHNIHFCSLYNGLHTIKAIKGRVRAEILTNS